MSKTSRARQDAAAHARSVLHTADRLLVRKLAEPSPRKPIDIRERARSERHTLEVLRRHGRYSAN